MKKYFIDCKDQPKEKKTHLYVTGTSSGCVNYNIAVHLVQGWTVSDFSCSVIKRFILAL